MPLAGRANWIATAATLGGALLLTACSGSSDGNTAAPAPVISRTTSSSPPTAVPSEIAGPTAPLTGQASTATGRARTALALAYLPGATALVGLGSADLVYESVETPGRHRLLALFQSRDPATAGPAGPARPQDAGLLRPLRATLVTAGGAPAGFLTQLAQAAVPVTTPAHAASSFRTVPGGTFLVAAALRTALGAAVAPSTAFLHSAAVRSAASGLRAVSIRPPGEKVQTWTFDPRSGAWTNPDEPGAVVTNLVVQDVAYRPTTQAFGGAPIQVPRTFGHGTATVFATNHKQDAQWYKANLAAPTAFLAGGEAVSFAPGATWVLLAPPQSALTTSPAGAA